MTKIIDGQKLAKEIKDDLVKKIVKLNGKRPNLAIVLIGEREDSMLYVKLKEKEAKKVGIDTHLYKCSESTTEKEIIETIKYLNKDKIINGILIQLPLPKKFNTDKIIREINPNKDVDCFHPDNLKKLNKNNKIISPVFSVVLYILNDINYNFKNKNICIISNSFIFGNNLAKILKQKSANITIVKFNDKNLQKTTKQADILISAIGKPKFIKKEFIKKGVIIIDIGIYKKGKKVYGDVDFNSVNKKASYISPVPGGVGPITIAMLFKNTFELYKKGLSLKN